MTATYALKLRDHETLVHDSGEGDEPIVLLHALGLDRRMWNRVIGALAPNRRTIAYDMRGNGHAAGAPPAPLDTYAEDLAELLDTLGLSNAHVAGVSMGGAVAMTFAGAYPQRARSLTMICAPALAVPAFAQRAEAALRDGMEAQVATTLDRWFSGDALEQDNEAISYARDCIRSNTPAGWASNWSALATFVATSVQAGVPVTLIAGSVDQSTPPEHMRKLLPHCPDADFQIIEGGSHMLVLERPAELAVMLRDATV